LAARSPATSSGSDGASGTNHKRSLPTERKSTRDAGPAQRSNNSGSSHAATPTPIPMPSR
jgi:hypothetical protein